MTLINKIASKVEYTEITKSVKSNEKAWRQKERQKANETNLRKSTKEILKFDWLIKTSIMSASVID